MAFGGYFKGEKRKIKKSDLEKKSQKHLGTAFSLPQVEILGKGKKKS